VITANIITVVSDCSIILNLLFSVCRLAAIIAPGFPNVGLTNMILFALLCFRSFKVTFLFLCQYHKIQPNDVKDSNTVMVNHELDIL
jgi:hypothetical protein